MKVGDKVQILGIFGEDKIDEKYVGLEGIIINIEDGDYPFEVEFEKEPKNNFSEDELELITDIAKESSFKLPSTNDFSVIISKSDTQEDINALWEYAASHGYAFNKHYNIDRADVGYHNYKYVNFCYISPETGEHRYGYSNNTYSVDNNSQLIPESNYYKLKEIINNNKKENMNEIERALREGDMAMKLAKNSNHVLHSDVNKYSVPNDKLINIKEEIYDSSIFQIKRRARRVGYVSHRIVV